MSFNEEGFLSPDLATWTTEAQNQHRDWFDMVNGLNRDAMTLLLAAQPPTISIRQQIVLQLYRRALQSFQGSILLASRGMIADALTLGRSCAETAIAIGAVANEDGFIARLIEAEHHHMFTYSNAILNDADSQPFLSQEQIDNLNRMVSEIRTRYQSRTPSRIRWEQAAIIAGMTDLYITVYRLTSGDAAHTTLSALGRHIQPNDQGAPETLTFRPENRQLPHALSMACTSLLHVIEGILRIFPNEDFQRNLHARMIQWASLETSQGEQAS
jgi:Family of unknown function (DUF5677)